MITYADSEDKCRSRMLLHYFGEKNEHNCGQCDVCLQKPKKSTDNKTYKELCTQIKEMLKASTMNSKELIQAFPNQEEEVEQVLHFLMGEEEVQLNNGVLSLKNLK